MRAGKKILTLLCLFCMASQIFAKKKVEEQPDFAELAKSANAFTFRKALKKEKSAIKAQYGANNDTLLMIAIEAGRKTDFLTTLLEAGVPLDAANDNGDTALIYAAKFGYGKSTLKMLLSYAASPSKKRARAAHTNNLGQKAADFLQDGSAEKKFLERYSEKKGRKNKSEPAEEIPEIEEEEIPADESDLQIEEETSFEEEIAQEPEIQTEPLPAEEEETPEPEKPAEDVPKKKRENRHKYLFEGLESFETYQIAEKKFEPIQNPDAKDENGRTPLQNAAALDDIELAKILLDSGASVDLPDGDGWTALMYAARFGKKGEVAAALIKAGANVKAKNRFGASVLEIAAGYGTSAEILEEIASRSTKSALVRAFFTAVGMGRPSQILEVFFRHGITANIVYKGKTPLMLAAQTNTDTNCIEFLLKSGADKTFVTADRKDAYYFAKQNPNLPRNDIFWSLNNSEK